jgi:Cu-Zn family superoxide dismutase
MTAGSEAGRPWRLSQRHFAILVALVGAGAVAAPLYAIGTGKEIKKAKATLVSTTGATLGVVKLKEKHGVVEVEGEAEGLTPGFHGFHVHTTGICDGTTGFMSAGGHFNPGGAAHSGHAGDMPVLLVKSDGSAEAMFSTDRFHVADLFDADGSAVIVHAGPDNYANIPTARYDPDPDATTLATGDAGGRVACGVLETRGGDDDD